MVPSHALLVGEVGLLLADARLLLEVEVILHWRAEGVVKIVCLLITTAKVVHFRVDVVHFRVEIVHF